MDTSILYTDRFLDKLLEKTPAHINSFAEGSSLKNVIRRAMHDGAEAYAELLKEDEANAQKKIVRPFGAEGE